MKRMLAALLVVLLTLPALCGAAEAEHGETDAFTYRLGGPTCLSGDVLPANSNMYPATGSTRLVQRGDALYPEGAGDVRITAGIHHPLAHYILDLKEIAEGDTRYIFLGSPEGDPLLQVRFTATGNGIRAELWQAGKKESVGILPASARQARFFFTESGVFSLYARGE